VAPGARFPLPIGVVHGRGPLAAPRTRRLPPPALHVVDRRSVPADASTGAADLLRRCAAGAAPGWAPAQVLAYRRAGQPASLLVATGGPGVGGCSVAPGDSTPLQPWGPGTADGARPFVWLGALPGLPADLVAGPVRPEVIRKEVGAGSGEPWRVAVAGGTFAGQPRPGPRPIPAR
jgi:hypothetical protein